MILKQDLIAHLEKLGEGFIRYFPGVDNANISMLLTRNPFVCQVDEIPEDIQEVFLELTHDSSAKEERISCPRPGSFWVRCMDLLVATHV